MHELAVMQSVVALCEREAAERGAQAEAREDVAYLRDAVEGQQALEVEMCIRDRYFMARLQGSACSSGGGGSSPAVSASRRSYSRSS